MQDFPAFMKNPLNGIPSSSQHTAGIEGYVYDGADGGQMAFWTCRESAKSQEHVHEYDEYMVVVEGCYTLLIQGQRIDLKAGHEYLIPERSSSRRRSRCRNKNNPCFRRDACRTRPEKTFLCPIRILATDPRLYLQKETLSGIRH